MRLFKIQKTALLKLNYKQLIFNIMKTTILSLVLLLLASCQDNKKDIEEIPEIYRKGVEFHYVENVADVWHFALTDEKVEHPIDFTIPEDAKKGE